MKHNQVRQVVFPLLAALIWGTAFVAQDICADKIGAFTFNAIRFFIAAIALGVMALIKDAVGGKSRRSARREESGDKAVSGSAVSLWKPRSRSRRISSN
ncbi:MAG: DMT family transporter [Eubacteriales bacterium]